MVSYTDCISPSLALLLIHTLLSLSARAAFHLPSSSLTFAQLKWSCLSYLPCFFKTPPSMPSFSSSPVLLYPPDNFPMFLSSPKLSFLLLPTCYFLSFTLICRCYLSPLVFLCPSFFSLLYPFLPRSFPFIVLCALLAQWQRRAHTHACTHTHTHTIVCVRLPLTHTLHVLAHSRRKGDHALFAGVNTLPEASAEGNESFHLWDIECAFMFYGVHAYCLWDSVYTCADGVGHFL